MCEVFQHLVTSHTQHKSEWESVLEYEAVLRDHGYDFDGEVDCIDWLRKMLAGSAKEG